MITTEDHIGYSGRRLPTVLGTGALLLGGIVLIGGWVFDFTVAKSVLPGLSTMKANTAVGIAALGGSLAASGHSQRGRLFALVAAGLALGLGVVTLAEYAFAWDPGIDELLFEDPDTASAAFPGRPAVATALMIALLSSALLCAHHDELRTAKTLAAITASLIAWASLNGHVFGSQALQEVPLFGTVALHTSVAMLMLGIGVLAVAPAFGPVPMIFSANIGGTVCRWLLPPALLAPPILGWLLSRSNLVNLYPSGFRWALYSAVSSLVAVWLILRLAQRITLVDLERTAATELSRHDPLTGIANRRAFDAFLLENFNLSKRHGHPLSLLLLDIDGFKSYNDAYGHPAGDELLKSMSLLLLSLLRATDLVARIGGEEFAITLPETDLAGGRVFAERVRAEVERSFKAKRPITVSVGIAGLKATTATPTALVQECDEALYCAKNTGRNRVAWTAGAELRQV